MKQAQNRSSTILINRLCATLKNAKIRCNHHCLPMVVGITKIVISKWPSLVQPIINRNVRWILNGHQVDESKTRGGNADCEIYIVAKRPYNQNCRVFNSHRLLSSINRSQSSHHQWSWPRVCACWSGALWPSPNPVSFVAFFRSACKKSWYRGRLLPALLHDRG